MKPYNSFGQLGHLRSVRRKQSFPTLTSIIAQVRKDVGGPSHPVWWQAACETYKELLAHRSQIRTNG